MQGNRKEIAGALEEIALLLELKGENAFKCRAFSAAARAIERADEDLAELAAAGRLTAIAGIGKSTAEQIDALLREGRSPLLDELQAIFPEDMRRILKIPGLGPKRLRVIHEALGVASIAELEYAIHENRLRDLPGFGAKSQENILSGIEIVRRSEGRFLLPAGWRAADQVLALQKVHGRRIEIAGELRRQMETLTEVLFVMEGPAGAPSSAEEIRTEAGIPVRILLRNSAAFEGCWLFESSSEEHRASLAARAALRGLRFSTEGLARDGAVLPLSEEAIYRTLDLDPVHPLLREGPAETAPRVTPVGPESVRGVFHVHTTESDGTGSLEEMVSEAERMGYQWIGISDHSRTAVYAHGLEPARLRAQGRAVAEVQARHPKIRIFHGTESDILSEGSLDYEDDLLSALDFVVVSIHSQFRMDRAAMTERIERALRHPATTHWGHPTGRLLLGRGGYDCDVDHLLEVCAEEGVSVEFNSNPHRLDLDWRQIPRAIELCVPISANPDAHAPDGLADARLTIGTAAKGGLTNEHLLNHLTVEEVAQWLSRRKFRRRR